MTVFSVHIVINQSQTGASRVVCQGGRHGPSITYKITPCWVTLLQPARRAAVLVQPSSLRPHWSKLPTYIHQSYCKKLPNFSCMKIHIMVCGSNYSAQLMMDLCKSLSWSPAFFPKDFPWGLFGDFFFQADFRPPPPPLFQWIRVCGSDSGSGRWNGPPKRSKWTHFMFFKSLMFFLKCWNLPYSLDFIPRGLWGNK
jgi:hypothetical protein